ncbi:hypothetical protein B296_00053598 [Ensete ventricosum]|uniref:Protein kinase domain-containing protein n=1 Tax=Ensete ventricosum TaxID=4639 RepID=A0A426Y7F3_ENSVE|nr:hypothetical protein B296_00053598 [Ensete ventricosum]
MAKVIFGKYELVRVLGRGTTAKVHHARHVPSGHTVAIKVFPNPRRPTSPSSSGSAHSFIHEISGSPPSVPPMTSSITQCGTPAYVAPEILLSRKGIAGYDRAKADIWSCGVVLFVLHAGFLPFNDYNLTSLYHKIHRRHHPCPRWTRPTSAASSPTSLTPTPPPASPSTASSATPGSPAASTPMSCGSWTPQQWQDPPSH